MHDYDTSYISAMPSVSITVSVDRNSPPLEILAIVDSGADATIIPLAYLEELGALPVDEGWLRSATGERHQIDLYEVYLRIGEFGQYITVVADEISNEAAIGRDILNGFVVTLDGIGSTVLIAR